MTLQGAVDLLAGSGQMRYAPRGTRQDIYRGIQEQMIHWGLCPSILVPQKGPWTRGECHQTLAGDILRSLGEVRAIAMLCEPKMCCGTGPVIARANYQNVYRVPQIEGVQVEPLGKGTHLEVWGWRQRKIPVLRGPHAAVEWLARQKGIHHVGQLTVKRWGRWEWKGWVQHMLEPGGDGDSESTQGKRRRRREGNPDVRTWLKAISDERGRAPVGWICHWLDWQYMEYAAAGEEGRTVRTRGMEVPEIRLGGARVASDSALRRVYPHFVRSEEKEGRVVLEGIGEVKYAGRRAAWIDSNVHSALSGKARWKRMAGVAREPCEAWGVSPEIEFFLTHALRVRKQHFVSPWTALRGG